MSSRAVIFFGPHLDEWVCRLVKRLEAEADVNVVGLFCQGSARARDRFKKLMRRRGLLAIPITTLRYLQQVGAFLGSGRGLVHDFETEFRSRIHYVSDIHAPEVLQRVTELQPDIGLVHGGPIYKPQLFEIPRLGTLGIHHGKAPTYRGRKSTFWAMMSGDTTTGVTIQKINAGVDTGTIVELGEVPIGDRSLRTLRREVYETGLDLYVKAVRGVLEGTARMRPQEPGGKYYGDPRFADYVSYLRLRAVQKARQISSRIVGSTERPK